MLYAQIVIGGTNQNSEMQRLRRKPPQILVATPGRCLDHLTCDSPLNVGGKIETLADMV